MILYAALSRYLFDPLTLLLILLIAAMVADHYRRQNLRRGLLAGAAVLLLALMLLPLDEFIARPLENQFPRPPLPAHVDGIVVLDAGLQSGVFASRGVPSESNSTMRLIAGADLARRFPAAKLVYSGTAGGSAAQRQREHDAAENLLRALGVPPGHTLFERTSRSTGENLANSMQLLHPRDGETWLLVTSAVHMPRAMAVAEKLGWKMLPWPSDYISTAAPRGGIHLSYPSAGLVDIDHALHEWIGLALYRLGSRT
ncbi:MAG TPA: YdcF family protein [Rhizomicrobium sp.]